MLAACGGGQKQAPPPPPTVSVAAPLGREVVDWDDYVGRFEAPQDVELRPRVTGTVTRIYFKNGQDVKRGEALFEIDPRPYRAALQQAEAQIARAEAAVTNARQVQARTQSLLEARAVSREEFENNQATVRSAEADLAAARAARDNARLNVGFTTLRAPFSGRVSDRRVDLGASVTADTTVMTRLVSIDPIWFSFEGAEAFYLKNLRQDQRGERRSSRYTANPVEIQLADETGYRWHGRMAFLDNAVDPNSGTIRAKAVVPNPTRFLTPGMFGRARLLGSGTYRALMIPDEAVVTDQSRKLVWVTNRENKVEQRAIETGPIVDGLRVVRAGLAPTDLVIIEGIGRLQPGMPVTPKRTEIKARPSDNTPHSQPLITPPSSQATSAGAQ
ncbi:efflux RND transporter periplasmic adaptor subunit [Sphingomonas sp. XMGL2]|uniref:Efflux RND transporter periplasmic adaptor subunit n=2 Tax=Sphingomonas quercus TaxID=2842451 RepID=A0ABS6BI58_9SPHN|nr:efflux RND transporter periplasmic adaptor subunit [Sphingomonas quercus]MBU3077272.1 efflux RND transporter periplasmic adaptor subunit [Sphingomonas quercus]